MLSLRRSSDRGFADHGWLKSYHSFSFGSYYDPQHMGISALRVINDDRVDAGAGFPTHPHRDMEILSYVLQGALEHKDSMGNIQTMSAGEFQLMSAGTGVTHSEYNPRLDTETRFLQIWIQPDQLGITPGYQQHLFEPADGLQLIAGPAGTDDPTAFKLQQDARIFRLQLQGGQKQIISGENKRPQYLHLVHGTLDINGMKMKPGDALTVHEESVEVFATTESEALLFDLPPPPIAAKQGN